MTTTARTYGGVDADRRASGRRERLLAAGLELLGSNQLSAAPTIRAVGKAADLGPRYFDESFLDGDALVVAVYDQVITDVMTSTLAALAAAEDEERNQIEVGLSAIIAVVAGDPRKGRVLFDGAVIHPALAQKRVETARLFSALLTAQAQSFCGVEPSGALDTDCRFLVGGLGETLTAWQHGISTSARTSWSPHAPTSSRRARVSCWVATTSPVGSDQVPDADVGICPCDLDRGRCQVPGVMIPDS